VLAKKVVVPFTGTTPTLVKKEEDGPVELLGLCESIAVGDPLNVVSKSMRKVTSGGTGFAAEAGQQRDASKRACKKRRSVG
jgi:hypothetical protein